MKILDKRRNEIVEANLVEGNVYDTLTLGRIEIIPDGRFEVVEEEVVAQATEAVEATQEEALEAEVKENFLKKVLRKVRTKRS